MVQSLGDSISWGGHRSPSIFISIVNNRDAICVCDFIIIVNNRRAIYVWDFIIIIIIIIIINNRGANYVTFLLLLIIFSSFCF